jgi:putative membrane protein
MGLGALWARGRALRGALDGPGLKRVFLADNLWGLAALLWVGTGLWRAFGGLEKGTAHYLASTAFDVKMGLFAAIGVLEIWPMLALITWRIRQAKGMPFATDRARIFGRISDVQVGLLVGMILAATAMARGW